MAVISENKLKEIISSVIEEQLSERGTNLSSLYHFTDIRGLVGIMRDGFFKLSSRQQDIRDGKNYMSFTRHKSPLEGFALPNECFVRIEVNPEVINSIHGKSIDSFEYYSPNRSKKAARCNPWAGITSDNGDNSAKAAYRIEVKNGFDADYSEFLNQAEEHLTSAKDSVYAEKAIKRIDICVVFDYSFCETSSERRYIYWGFLEIFQMANSPLYDKIFIYDNKRDFSLQTDNCTPIREYPIEKLQNALDINGTKQNVVEGITKSNKIKTNKNMKKNVIKLNESQLRNIVMEVTRHALKGMKSATKDVHAKANEQSPEEKKYNRATSKPKPSHWKPLGKNDYENMRNGNVDGLSDKAVNMLHATMNNDDKAYRKAKYGELKENTNMDTPNDENYQFDDLIHINEHKRKNTIKLNESQLREIISSVIMESLGKEGIHIKEKNRGKFTATKERTGKSTEELTHSKNPLTKKRAIFVQNAKKWNKKK